MDPLAIFLLICGGMWLSFRLGRMQARYRQDKKARVEVELKQERDPLRRRELLLQWNDLGGYHETKTTYQADLMGKLGQQARMRGEPLSANPCRTALWGKGRLWKHGWKSVDRQVRWIHKQRRKSSGRSATA